MRTKGWGNRASPFLYQLSPRFSPWRDFDGTWNMVLRMYIRVTTPEGVPFEGKEMGRRRKIVTKSWWNKEWLARLLGVVQALETSEGHANRRRTACGGCHADEAAELAVPPWDSTSWRSPGCRTWVRRSRRTARGQKMMMGATPRRTREKR